MANAGAERKIEECAWAFEAMRESDARFRMLVESSLDIIYTVDSGGIITSLNPAFMQITGWTAEEWIGKSFNPLIHPEDLPFIVSRVERITRGELLPAAEVRLATKSGEYRWVEFKTVPMVKNGQVIGLMGTARDITDRKRAEEALRESEQRYRTLVESSSDAILLVDQERMIVSFNQAFLHLSGFGWNEVQGKSTRIIHDSEASYTEFWEKASKGLEESGSFRTEWDFMQKSGELVPVEETLSVMRDPGGLVRGYVAVIRDISERKQVEEKLEHYRSHLEDLVLEKTRDLDRAYKALLEEEKQKTLCAISADMAHEIRNPLMSLGGFARRLKSKLPEVAELGIIMRESERLEKILGRIEDYLRPIDMHPTECSVNRSVTESLLLISEELGVEGISLELELAPELPPAYADCGILMQALIDVVRKAFRVMKKKEKITIGTLEGNRNIHVYVRAPVLGVKIKDPEHLFMPFGDDDFSLAACFRTLRAMGGYVSLKQEEDAVLFSATLPKAPDSMQ